MNAGLQTPTHESRSISSWWLEIIASLVSILSYWRLKNKPTWAGKTNKGVNKFIKLLLEQADFTHTVHTTRGKRRVAAQQKKEQQTYRFCDVATTHTMRPTAITTMLSLGVHEQVVRKISGYSASGKEFYRYVL